MGLFYSSRYLPSFSWKTSEIMVGGSQMHTLTGHTDTVWSVVFSPNGNLVVSGSYDTFVKIWDVATGALVSSFVGLLGVW